VPFLIGLRCTSRETLDDGDEKETFGAIKPWTGDNGTCPKTLESRFACLGPFENTFMVSYVLWSTRVSSDFLEKSRATAPFPSPYIDKTVSRTELASEFSAL